MYRKSDSRLEPGHSKRELKHVSHKHPLYFEHEQKIGAEVSTCNGCEQPIWGPSYGCLFCYFFLHKSCAELPQQITHPILHSHHPLTINVYPPYGAVCSCTICGRRCEKFFYECSSCDFCLDIVCLSTVDNIQGVFQHSSHQHPLIYLSRPASFFCLACGEEHRGVSFLCTTCGFWVSQKCASLPTTVKCRDHHHPLTLSFSLPDEYYQFRPNCDICKHKLNRPYWVYFCAGCRYFSHLSCATSKAQDLSRVCETEVEGEDLDSNFIKLPPDDADLDPITLFIKSICLEGNYEKAAEISHVSHDHQLILVDKKINDDSNLKKVRYDGNCNGCTKPVSAPFYQCAQCNFFIHEYCAKLPNELRHPCHLEHPLLSIAQQTSNSLPPPNKPPTCHPLLSIAQQTTISLPPPNKPPTCQGCAKDWSKNVFMFGCSACKFYLDIRCASMPHLIRHKAHKRSLRLRIIPQGTCSTCMGIFSGLVFACEGCNFQICCQCVLLPREVKHRYDEHPFSLTYLPTENHPGEYLCEICEYDINPKYWFYHCIDCDQSLHTGCVQSYLGLFVRE